MADIRQVKEYANYLRQTGWLVETIDGVNYFIRKFPVGSVLKIQRPAQLASSTVNQLANKYHAFQIIVEPNSVADCSLLTGDGFKRAKSTYLPSKTLVLNLSQPKEKILAQMKKDAKSAIRKSDKLRTMNYELKNLVAFRAAWKEAVGWKRYIPPLKNLVALKKSFGSNSLFLATKNSGAIFLVGGPSTLVRLHSPSLRMTSSAYYWQAFTSAKGRKNLEQYKIVWEGICWARRRGAKGFDFEGIYDERFPNKSWLGFTHFKKSFGGKEIEFPGCYTKWTLPL